MKKTKICRATLKLKGEKDSYRCCLDKWHHGGHMAATGMIWERKPYKEQLKK